ncbi:hypothetical protein ACQP1K_16240 [Sphaerimonospora sp. CA-214678]|uniref:hypothetical protein n=1 Tax=Sphaerimonospora sp. CA-214678 TaxID=3240029 RepID=UPI003D8BCD9D
MTLVRRSIGVPPAPARTRRGRMRALLVAAGREGLRHGAAVECGYGGVMLDTLNS